MRLPPDYQAILDHRPPSWVTALLPEAQEAPSITEVLGRLGRCGLDIAGARPAGDRESSLSRWEIEVQVRFSATETTPFRVWLEPTERYTRAHLDWPRLLTRAEQEAARRSRWSLGVSTLLGRECLRGFHHQLRLLDAVAPEITVVMDLAACTPHPEAWLREVAASRVPPAPTNLYAIHAVYDDRAARGPRWMHTHGLLRCGSIELEILNAPDADVDLLSELLNAVAPRFIEDGPVEPDEPFLAGEALSLVWLPWREALARVPGGIPGLGPDRDPAHSLPSGALFAPGRRLFGRRYEGVSRYAPALAANPVLHASRSETERARLLAFERLRQFLWLQEEYRGSSDWKFLVKLGYETDAGAPREHLWFAVHACEGDTFDATLVNAPGQVSHLREGVRGLHPLDRLSDWAILCPFGQFSPDSVIYLERELGSPPRGQGLLSAEREP
jgi:hypothetical protein